MTAQEFLSNHYSGADGLRDLLRKTKDYTNQLPLKLRAMQAAYLKNNPALYTTEQIASLRYFLDAIWYKDLMTSWQVEEIWGIVRTGTEDELLVNVLRNVYDEYETGDDDLLLLSFLLDNFLLQATAFLDFYTLYLCEFFQLDKERALGKGILTKLDSVDVRLFGTKGQQVKDYFEKRVIAASPHYYALSIINWGGILRSLRHSTIHRDREMPSFAPAEELVEKKVQEWPAELRNIKCTRFCEDVQGDMFAMVSKLAGVLYEIEWQPGPYVPGMFKDK